MRVIFSHGKESGPWGSKIKYLAGIAEAMGCQVDSIDYTDTVDPELRVKHLLTTMPQDDPEVLLVGSSMGGYVSLVAALEQPVKGIFLLAPAVGMPGYKVQDFPVACPVTCVHGWQDEIIPAENVLAFAKKQNATLHLIPGDHRLNHSLKAVGVVFKQFLFERLTE
ncbi:YqiA/YcfP family alpha/beta fold hydrolase [Alteromonas gilva]|uniref:Alpha/beta hydrolase n=1 Tax=Alteromonas gilva TaxID=2987522 RepID=A0ABT5L2E0_9ALTE|nr:YqiA/YcfP family alpha/beta fold hydrolase [Alteromonas gilva]MDC8831210.1 alpha/beta hydrolase [Alteromonas gilva]